MSGAWALVASLGLLAANAFFVGAEFALVGARRSQIEPLADEGSKRARKTLAAMENVSLMMAGAQLGITICSIGLGALAKPALKKTLHGPLEAIGLPASWESPTSLVLALTIVVAAHVVLGEMVPKNLTLAEPDRAALVLGPALGGLVRLIGPFLRVINWIANLGLRLFGVTPRDEVLSTFDVFQVAQLAQQSHREGMIDDEEYRLMRSAVAFATNTTAADVYIPWQFVTKVTTWATVTDVELLAGRTRHVRFPVVDRNGKPTGYLSIKDLISRSNEFPAEAQVRPLTRIMPSVDARTPLPEVLLALRAPDAAMALVISENGDPLGVVTLDNVIAALVDFPISPI